MTARALAILALCGLPAVASAARTDDVTPDVTPERYLLSLSPNAARHSFAGRETIELTVAAPTRTLTLDAAGLTVTEARVSAGDASLTATTTTARDRLTLTLPSPVGGAVRVELAWSGALADDLGGMFAAGSGGHRALFTHFEPSGARRVFPSFDTPQKRARFELTVDVDAGDAAVSNTPIVERTPLGAHRERVRFAETPSLPTYLVALAVGRFATLDAAAGATPIRVVAPAEELPLARFALDTAQALLPRFADYFGRAYPFAKLDLVAVPAFAPGGMENAGAIFLRDDHMLVDPARASPATTHAIALLVAHELAHQWLGDVVTPASWNDLWLAEATATYVAHEIVAAWHPEWRPWDDLQPAIGEVMADDELPAAHPVRASDGGRALFDAFVYTKGAALLRMLAGWSGDDVVRGAFRRLVDEHAFSAITADDFWAALDAAADAPLSPVARRWFEERGHPTLLAHASCDGATLTLFVRRDRPLPAAPIPLFVRWPGGTRTVLFDDEASVRIDGGARCPAWVDANAGRAGFYRVHYDPVLAATLAATAEAALEPAERVGLASDAWLDLRDGAPMASYLALALALRGDRAAPVLDELGRRLAFMSAYLVRDPSRSAFERFVDELLEPAHAALGLTARPADDDGTLLARARTVELLGTLARTPHVLADADRQLRRYLADPAAVDGAMADAVVALGALGGDAARFDAYLQHLHAARTPDVAERFRDALTRFERPALIHRALALLLTGVVPAQELMRFCADLADNVRGRPTEWRFLKSHFDALERKSPRTGWLLPTTQRFCDAGAAREIARFFAEREPYVSPASAVAETTERIASCAALRPRAGAELSAWLRARFAEARKAGRR